MDFNKYPSEEYRLIDRLKGLFNQLPSSRYPIGIGDDAAVRRCSTHEQLIMTADIAVEGVHFSRDYMTFEEIGYRAMVANISDCAAMGAVPDSALVQVGFPIKQGDMHVVEEEIVRLHKGFLKACHQWEFPIVGGDLSQAPCWIIAISLTGRKEAGERVLTRTGAKADDMLWATGVPGKSGAGLAVLQKWGRGAAPEEYRELVDAHVAPQAMVTIGRKLADDPAVHCMIDLSDGIAKECYTLCYENNMGIILHPDTDLCAKVYGKLGAVLNTPWHDWFLYGGEDYHLLFTTAADFSPRHYSESALLKIGKITQEKNSVVFIDDNGSECEVEKKAWDHIRIS